MFSSMENGGKIAGMLAMEIFLLVTPMMWPTIPPLVGYSLYSVALLLLVYAGVATLIDWRGGVALPFRIRIRSKRSWWVGREYLTVREMAALAAGVSPQQVEETDLGRSVYRQVLEDAKASRFPVHASAETMHTGSPYVAVSSNGGREVYARSDDKPITEDSLVPLAFVKEYLQRSRYPLDRAFRKEISAAHKLINLPGSNPPQSPLGIGVRKRP